MKLWICLSWSLFNLTQLAKHCYGAYIGQSPTDV